jgi:hypothetical protein
MHPARRHTRKLSRCTKRNRRVRSIPALGTERARWPRPNSRWHLAFVLSVASHLAPMTTSFLTEQRITWDRAVRLQARLSWLYPFESVGLFNSILPTRRRSASQTTKFAFLQDGCVERTPGKRKLRSRRDRTSALRLSESKRPLFAKSSRFIATAAHLIERTGRCQFFPCSKET